MVSVMVLSSKQKTKKMMTTKINRSLSLAILLLFDVNGGSFLKIFLNLILSSFFLFWSRKSDGLIVLMSLFVCFIWFNNLDLNF